MANDDCVVRDKNAKARGTRIPPKRGNRIKARILKMFVNSFLFVFSSKALEDDSTSNVDVVLSDIGKAPSRHGKVGGTLHRSELRQHTQIRTRR
ncbi:hypothetical protein Sjap_002228 [Stephania japonica]|uniref:Uncharacterized protein n=1 Tax=Stephania japonica TaxID=461633 RepID=A0AAP0PSC5_9MAGN